MTKSKSSGGKKKAAMFSINPDNPQQRLINRVSEVADRLGTRTDDVHLGPSRLMRHGNDTSIHELDDSDSKMLMTHRVNGTLGARKQLNNTRSRLVLLNPDAAGNTKLFGSCFDAAHNLSITLNGLATRPNHD